jgi:hypothetical protein
MRRLLAIGALVLLCASCQRPATVVAGIVGVKKFA